MPPGTLPRFASSLNPLSWSIDDRWLSNDRASKLLMVFGLKKRRGSDELGKPLPIQRNQFPRSGMTNSNSVFHTRTTRRIEDTEQSQVLLSRILDAVSLAFW